MPKMLKKNQQNLLKRVKKSKLRKTARSVIILLRNNSIWKFELFMSIYKE